MLGSGVRRTLITLLFTLVVTVLFAIILHQASAASVTLTNGTNWTDTASNPINANSGSWM